MAFPVCDVCQSVLGFQDKVGGCEGKSRLGNYFFNFYIRKTEVQKAGIQASRLLL
jgi:hypothetical protein